MNKKAAFLDLGTNTFHLLIVQLNQQDIEVIYKESIFVKIGQGGISKGSIADEAIERAVQAIKHYYTIIKSQEVGDIIATATSAIRSATNGYILIEKIYEATGLSPIIIGGDIEAELIYHGVKSTLTLADEPSLIMDIGGGSVEFIIGSNKTIHWKESIEIGAQRLFDRFHQKDPITEEALLALKNQVLPVLSNVFRAIERWKPSHFIGSSGTFDTLKEINRLRKNSDTNHRDDISLASFKEIYRLLVENDREARMAIPGMIEKRVDMIVTAVALLNIILDKGGYQSIIVSKGALKEGLVSLYQSDKLNALLQKKSALDGYKPNQINS